MSVALLVVKHELKIKHLQNKNVLEFSGAFVMTLEFGVSNFTSRVFYLDQV